MRKVMVKLSLSLDGVMQAPGRPEEDNRDGFKRGGWALPYFDPVMMQAAAEGMSEAPALLFGRRTYQDFHAVWPNRTNNPFTEVLNAAEKYVVSRTLKEPLPWNNSILLKGEGAESIARIKSQPGKDLLIMGSGELVRALMSHKLIDELSLSIHPLVLGSGQRLFPGDGAYAGLQLVDSKTTSTGVLMTRYRPIESKAG